MRMEGSELRRGISRFEDFIMQYQQLIRISLAILCRDLRYFMDIQNLKIFCSRTIDNFFQVWFLENICSGDICPGQKLLDQNSSWINFTLGAKCILTNLFWDQHVFDQNPAIETCPYYSKAYSIWTYSG